jgi:hypothetical protein
VPSVKSLNQIPRIHDIQHNDTQLEGLICETRHKVHSANKTHHVKTECHILFIVMLNVIMLYVVTLSVVAQFHPFLLKQRKSDKRTSLLWTNYSGKKFCCIDPCW